MSNKPKLKLSDGLITATVWENTIQTDNGEQVRFSTEINRSYKDGDDWKTTYSFNPTDLLKVARLAERAYDQITAARQADKEGAQ